MSWYKRYPALLYAEWEELLSNTNYKEVITLFEKTFISCGQIIVRSNEVQFFPVLIVYPETTPYRPPSVYLLKEIPTEETLRHLAQLSPGEIEKEVKPFIRFLYRRHQGPSGSLCFVELEDLHADQAEFYGIREILKRVRDWLAGIQTGRIPPDSPEVELFSHFPNQNHNLIFLIPDSFFDEGVKKGRFYFSKVTPSVFDKAHKVYVGVAIEGFTTGNIITPLKEGDDVFPLHGYYIPTAKDILEQTQIFRESLRDGGLIEGFWWDIDKELEPFATVQELAQYFGGQELGLKSLLEDYIADKLKNDEEFFIGIRFPGRTPLERKFEWQLFYLRRTKNHAGSLLTPKEKELTDRLFERKVEAFKIEYIDEKSFFKRNKGIFSRDNLKNIKISLFGLGALGSEVADNLSKAGVGYLLLLDKEFLKAQNTVRHLCGGYMLYFPKTTAVAIRIVENIHHFVKIKISAIDDIFKGLEGELFPDQDSISVSTIADDNTEAFLNELAVKCKRTVFYARALRGAKVARIFRVIPGTDACKTCISLYYQEDGGEFIKIEEDSALPVITTECNNPIRPASAADLKLIASLAARVVLEYLEKGDLGFNHWIWSSEALPGLPVSIEIPFIVKRQFLPPHPDCPVCHEKIPTPILLAQMAKASILEEVKKARDVETGGILIGFETEERDIIVLRASGPGPKAVMTKTRFEKDIEYCQQQLEEASRELGIRGLYVGEWHFHPSGSNHPSALDIKSMYGIAHQENYATEKPAMIIIGPSHNLSGTIHYINSEYLGTELNDIDFAEALKRKSLLHP
jgi:integrative and conjugative element protein (TIGR02256 family)